MTSDPKGQSPPAADDARRRILLAMGALGFFGVVVVIILLASGGGTGGAAASPAPQECLDAWNDDPKAVAFARHNSIFHNYDRAQVGYLTAKPGESVTDEQGAGNCAVVFARNSLDPEALAAGQILGPRGWRPLTTVIPVQDVARLQSEAFDGANAEPTREGEIVATAE